LHGTGAIFEFKIHKNAFAAGALPQTPLGELYSTPQTSSSFSGGRFTGGERRTGEGGDGSVGGKGR